MVQTQACSSGKCRNLHCWCKFLQGTRYQSHTRWHLTKRHYLKTLFCCQESSTRWEVCSGELHPTARHNPLQTFTVSAVWCDLVTMVTGAFVGAFQIDTATMETDSREHALVHIWREDIEEEKGGLRKQRKPLTPCSLFINRKWCREASVVGPWRSICRAVTLIWDVNNVCLSFWLTGTLANVVRWEFVSLETVAPIGALGVDTPTTAAHCLVQALI